MTPPQRQMTAADRAALGTTPGSLSGSANGGTATRSPARRSLGDAFGQVTAFARRWPELTLLALLFLLTAIFSRTFSKVSVGPIYVTEIVMAICAVTAVARLGVAQSWRTLRERLPMPALILIWVVAAIATVRGLRDYGLDMVTHDVGLADYTLLLPILALVVLDRTRYEAMFKVLVACGFAGIVGFVVVFTSDQISGHANTLYNLQGSAAGLYMSFAVCWVAARVVNGVPTSRYLTALVPVGLVLMGLTGQRSTWMIALLSLAAVVMLAPRDRRLRSGLVLTVLLPISLAGAIGIQAVLVDVAPAESTAVSTIVPIGNKNGVVTREVVVPGRAENGTADTRGSQNLSTTGNNGAPQLTNEISGLVNGNSDEGQNIKWRLAYWEELVRRTPHAPILGVGFGRPAAFTWQGRKYDFRDGDPQTGIDVAGPHNSFVNFLWRLGIPAFIALMAIILIALLRVRDAVRAGLDQSSRVALSTLLGMLAAGAMASSFNEGLTGPFLGIFFWVPLAMLLLWPGARGRDGSPVSPR
jgi:hypothetical protein